MSTEDLDEMEQYLRDEMPHVLSQHGTDTAPSLLAGLTLPDQMRAIGALCTFGQENLPLSVSIGQDAVEAWRMYGPVWALGIVSPSVGLIETVSDPRGPGVTEGMVALIRTDECWLIVEAFMVDGIPSTTAYRTEPDRDILDGPLVADLLTLWLRTKVG